jgi:endonuclease/exonuclease/phosphatase (EEP) superfamily protein YafD
VSACFRLITANLLNGGADPAAFADLIEALKVDAVAVQELSPEQARAIERALPFGKLEPARDYGGMGIALRDPGNVWRLPLAGRGAFVAEVTPRDVPIGSGIELINVHIIAPHVWPVARSLRHRREQLEGLERYLDASRRRPRAIVGDYNSTPIWGVYRRLAARLGDAAVEAARGRGGRPARTWGPWPGAPRMLRIDHALVSELTVRDCRALAIRGSDHSALLVDLSP